MATGRRISTLSFDPTKIQKNFSQRDKSDKNSFLDEQFSKEGLLCQLCGETFHTEKSLALHMRLHSLKEEQNYAEKQRRYESNQFFDDDVDDDDDMENDNSVSFPQRARKPRKPKYECSICQKKFHTKESIRTHMKIHSGDTPYQCPMCVKRFAHGSNLHRHLTVAHKDRDEGAAELCAKLMREINNHENRMVVYTGDKPKPYKCGFCSKEFKRLYRVKSHTRSHTGQKPFQCSVCNKVFSSSDTLYRHVKKLHNRGAPISKVPKLKVEEGEQENEKVKDLDSHTTIIQIDDGSGSTYSIPVQQAASSELTFLHTPRQGGEVFTINGDGTSTGSGPTYYIDLRNSELTQTQPMDVQMVQDHPQQQQQSHLELQQHLPDHDGDGEDDDHHEPLQQGNAATHSPEKAFQCSLCGESFATSPLLNKHISTHKFPMPCKCYVCGKVFKQESYLKRHMVCHTDERPFKCELCPKAFKRQYRLQNHWRSHTGERPYACSVCNKAFAISDSLYKHIKKVHKGVGLDMAATVVKQVQEILKEKKYAEVYGDIEVIEGQDA